MKQINKRINWFQAIGFGLIVLLTVETILLIKQNRELKIMLKSMSMISEVEPLKPGERVEPIKVQALDGSMSELSYNDPSRKYLLFVLSTNCPHCEKTLVNWKHIVERNTNDRCSIVGLSVHNLDETIKYISKKDVSFYLASVFADTSFNRKYKVSGVPETILVKGDGTVEKVWIGELSDEVTKEIQDLSGA